jgi:hypothetical protein
MLISYNILRDTGYQQHLSLSNMPMLTPMAANENTDTSYEANGSVTDNSTATATAMNVAPLVDLLSIGVEPQSSSYTNSITASSSVVLPMSVSSNTNGTSNSTSSKRGSKSVVTTLSTHDRSVIAAARNAANELSALSAEIMKVRYVHVPHCLIVCIDVRAIVIVIK